jgi:gluconokinase
MTGALVVMGVSGAGKTTLGQALAATLGWRFVEGDTLHPPANIERMAAGIALDDAARRPFLENVGDVLAAQRARGVVVTCSALKRAYRDLIRARAGAVTFVLPQVARSVLAERLAQRRGHFMPASLLDSQLATLELPGPDEDAIVVEGTETVERQTQRVLAALAQRTPS